jgi:hypothetical protein
MHLFLAAAKRQVSAQLLGVPAGLDTEEDFLSCAQREKETLPDFYQRFLQLNAQAPEVSDEQVIV